MCAHNVFVANIPQLYDKSFNNNETMCFFIQYENETWIKLKYTLPTPLQSIVIYAHNNSVAYRSNATFLRRWSCRRETARGRGNRQN